MEFKSLKNFESSFRHIRLFSMLFLGLCALVAVIAVLGRSGTLRNNAKKFMYWSRANRSCSLCRRTFSRIVR